MASPENSLGASAGTSMSSTDKSAGSAASDLAHQATQRVRDQTAKAADQAQRQAQAFLAEQKEVAAGHIENVAQVLHQTVDQLRERSPGAVSDYAERAVGGIDSLATALREQDVRALVGQVEDFARRQPVLFLAGTVAAGFALARFLKSSSSGEQDYGRDATQYAHPRTDDGAYAYPADAGTAAYGVSAGAGGSTADTGGGSPSPQFGTSHSTGLGGRATAEEIQRAMGKESK